MVKISIMHGYDNEVIAASDGIGIDENNITKTHTGWHDMSESASSQ